MRRRLRCEDVFHGLSVVFFVVMVVVGSVLVAVNVHREVDRYFSKAGGVVGHAHLSRQAR